ncbi:MAG: ribonuclease D [Pseudohongiellaceae bacterium]|jgi:ribonuclease D
MSLQALMKPELKSQTFEWVDTNERLKQLCAQWSSEKALALDTEFIRTDTFYPIMGLLQIADTQGIYLLDPLAINNKEPLQELWKNTAVVKIIHSCSEDLEVFNRYLEVLPTPLFDTQVAAAFVGIGSSMGYSNLVELLFGDLIPKDETRSDWLQRPLSDAQLNYAALDVVHLLPIYHELTQRLSDQQRLQWVELECAALITKASTSNSVTHHYLRIKSAWKLQPKQLAVLKALCSWRESETRVIDIPRNRLIKDSALFDIAQRLPKTKDQLIELNDVNQRFFSSYGEHCLQLIDDVLADDDNYPDRLVAPLNAEQRKLFKQLKTHVVDVAEKISMPAEYLVRKKELEEIVRYPQQALLFTPKALKGWREAVITKSLLSILSETINDTDKI